jgi:hypothetical protein
MDKDEGTVREVARERFELFLDSAGNISKR